MLIIQSSMWRAEYIAAIEYDKDQIIAVLPVNCTTLIEYEFDTPELALSAYKELIDNWTKELNSKKSKISKRK